MHLAIPPSPVRNPEKGFKTCPKKTRTESVSTNESESIQTPSKGSSKRSFRRSIINAFAART
ncbi:hypothetical protein N7516_006753 [Penicillium verrucosum]|uniref:uncharacterized protein n=1 Tax=Penicillium verrucosum TaxID=60171 RepID=UPI00254595B8|nr:uncharacterized protein N7516_006753 [Penicillium verrucosum]KAJ5932264.1 hypothetical protein N7516_006753 [Penicillium verrucosum]